MNVVLRKKLPKVLKQFASVKICVFDLAASPVAYCCKDNAIFIDGGKGFACQYSLKVDVNRRLLIADLSIPFLTTRHG